jgi:hypothetical protein
VVIFAVLLEKPEPMMVEGRNDGKAKDLMRFPTFSRIEHASNAD